MKTISKILPVKLLALATLLAVPTLGLSQSEPAPDYPLWLTLSGSDEARSATGIPAKKVVLVSGDEEYRSEEALPMLAKILSEQHGFDCVVLFSINPETMTVDPNHTQNIPGLEHLDDADAMILFTRFRQLPESQMERFESFLKRGGSIIALRTATHPFNFPRQTDNRFANWSWNNRRWEGGFGKQILGETWYTHHGGHKTESQRGVVAEEARNHPIVNGVNDLWAPSDVYGVRALPEDTKVLVYGQVLKGMEPTDPPVEDGRNEPMMPIVWIKPYQYEDGTVGKAFCSTICSSIDLLNEDLRRLIVNATYWATGHEDKTPAKASVELPPNYKPTMFGFTDPNFFRDQRIKPTDLLP